MTLYTIGLGCRRGVGSAAIDAAVRFALGATWSARLLPDAGDHRPFAGGPAAVDTHASGTGTATWNTGVLVQVATLDAKATESGLLDYCARHRLALRHFPQEALAALAAHAPDVSRPSDAVRARFGIDGVCELAALCASPRGVLLVRKTSRHGVSVALSGPAATGPVWEDASTFTDDR
ncbi:cobalamin biosynthesis protein [Robbsia sp. Bb-Pol-6]|uniref:Cobalamin biosynthesis protein n=1 Tax=Robbsia betulipollinis TaxID=2981849 RepID=A0ABT3ZGQ1_9BURK|nr:cobalamin biosynthesis protein [Robbsia betulipollinis]MCY0385705.1 cobalamin biosynthesis protein [Robbsia betulipollinis]